MDTTIPGVKAANDRVQARVHLCASAPFLLAFAGYSMLAVVLTFPLIRYLTSHIPRDLEDSLWYVSRLWWNAQVVPFSDRWWNGFSSYPASGAFALSDHLLGASLIASPLQWLGFGPVAAYNLTFLASFPLCAIAAHWLAFTLTRRHGAALVCGLGYGFNPYRLAHLEHLELLLAFGMPIALAAMHGYVTTRRWMWLVIIAAALIVQALSASYYAAFFTIFAGMWALWFIRPHAWRDAVAIGAAGAVALAILSPIVIGYSRIYETHNLTRSIHEVRLYSGDVTSYVTASPMSAVWGWTSPLNIGERQLFPGLTITGLAMAGVIASRRRRTAARGSLPTVSRVCGTLSACGAAIALATHTYGAWRFELGPILVSASGPEKVLSQAAALAIVAAALCPTMRAAFHQRSPLAFYVIAAAAFFLCSLGPQPTFLQEQVLVEGPYAWLMNLPLFSDGDPSIPAIRVPARFAMLTALALATAGSLAFARLTASRRSTVALVVVLCAIAADGWARELPLPQVPTAGLRIPADDPSRAVLELPPGQPRFDVAAMHRTTVHRRPTVNGYESYIPLSHHVLRRALADRDQTVLDALASFGPIAIAIDRAADPELTWTSFVDRYPGIERMDDDGRWTLFRLPAHPPATNRCRTSPGTLGPQHERARRTVRSEDVHTGMMLDLGETVRLCGLVLSVADAIWYPRTVRAETSMDRAVWTTAFHSRMGGAAFQAALANPRNTRIVIPLGDTVARFVRLSFDDSQPHTTSAVAAMVHDGMHR